jgi:hypothetical protein
VITDVSTVAADVFCKVACGFSARQLTYRHVCTCHQTRHDLAVAAVATAFLKSPKNRGCTLVADLGPQHLSPLSDTCIQGETILRKLPKDLRRSYGELDAQPDATGSAIGRHTGKP